MPKRSILKWLIVIIVVIILALLIILLVLWHGSRYPVRVFSKMEAKRIDQTTVELYGRINSGNSATGYVRHTVELKENKLFVTVYYSLAGFPFYCNEGPIAITIHRQDLPKDIEVVLCGPDGEVTIPLEER